MILKFLILHLKLALIFICVPLVLVLEMPIWIKALLVGLMLAAILRAYRRFLSK